MNIFAEFFKPDPYNFTNTICGNKHRAFHAYRNNVFFNKQMRTELQDTFYRAQRQYFAFAKLAQIYKTKYAKSTIKTDLYLNQIDTKHKNSIQIRQDGTIYWFTLIDLMNHIETALTYSPYYFPEPTEIKNPYTNITFPKSVLYTIWLKIRASTYRMPSLLQNFVLCGFDRNKFTLNHDTEIREQFIRRYIYNGQPDTLFEEIEDMLGICDMTIHPDIPREPIIKILRPYLYLYMVARMYVQGLEKKTHALLILTHRLRVLRKFNPGFGRYMVIKGVRIYNLDHPIYRIRDVLTY